MAWTTPKTDWSTGELVAASDLNTIGENLAALRSLSATIASHTTTADIAAHPRNFAHVDSDNLNLTITTTGGDVLLHFHGSITQWDDRSVFLDIEIDGARIGGVDGTLVNLLPNPPGSNRGTSVVSFTRLIQNLNAGSHTFKLQWKGGATQTLRAGAQFWAREI